MGGRFWQSKVDPRCQDDGDSLFAGLLLSPDYTATSSVGMPNRVRSPELICAGEARSARVYRADWYNPA